MKNPYRPTHPLAAGVCLAGVLVLCAASSEPVHAQIPSPQFKPSGPDFLHTIGVGGRAVAMGDAFTAIANDASATFWNPGRLGALTRSELMFQVRSAGRTFQSITGNGVSNTNSTGFQPGKLQPSFVGFTYRVNGRRTGSEAAKKTEETDDPDKLVDTGVPHIATIGVSYALGGYLNSLQAADLVSGADSLKDTRSLLIRNHYLTVAVGRNFDVKGGSTIGLGASYYRLSEAFSSQRVTTNTFLGNTTTDTVNVRETGSGDGYSLGAVFTTAPGSQLGNYWSAGATYRSAAQIRGLSPTAFAFGDEVPSRLSLGAAYQTNFVSGSGAEATPLGRLILSTEAQMFSSANDLAQEDYRKSVTNYHFGLEYRTEPGRNMIPMFGLARDEDVYQSFRLGYRTNCSAVRYAVDDNVISLGFGLDFMGGVDGRYFSLDAAAEILERSGAVQWTVAGKIRF